jgi:hypothetical protein
VAARDAPPVPPSQESSMSNVDPTKEIKLALTDEQKKQIKNESGHEASAISFTVEELEARVTPRSLYPEAEI